MVGQQGGDSDKEAEGRGDKGNPDTVRKKRHIRPASQGGQSLEHLYHAEDGAEKSQKRRD